jgi:ribosome-associated protein
MITRKRLRPAEERASPLQQAVTTALDDMKAVNIRVLDVRGLTDIADTMVIASGNSDRHVRSIAERVAAKAKAAGFRPLGTEGTRDGEWVLVDLQDILVHVMLPRVREFYDRRPGGAPLPRSPCRAWRRCRPRTRKFRPARAAPAAARTRRSPQKPSACSVRSGLMSTSRRSMSAAASCRRGNLPPGLASACRTVGIWRF